MRNFNGDLNRLREQVLALEVSGLYEDCLSVAETLGCGLDTMGGQQMFLSDSAGDFFGVYFSDELDDLVDALVTMAHDVLTMDVKSRPTTL